MTDSPNLGLPLIEAAQAQKHVTHNAALALLDALAQIAVSDIAAAAPPASPANGARVIVGAGAGGAFAGHAGKIAIFDAGVWRFAAPREGWLAWSMNDDAAFVFDGAAWTRLDSSLRFLQDLTRLGVGTSADVANPLSAKLNAALFTARYAGEAGNGDLRFTLNKEAAARSVSQLYQTNWSGRAETGLMGDDRYRVKVSPDGATWLDAYEIEPTNGQSRFRAGAATAPGLAFIGDEDTGAFRPGANQLAWSTGGVERARLTEAGHLGVGVTAPATRLELRGATASFTEPLARFRAGGNYIVAEIGEGAGAGVMRLGFVGITSTFMDFDGGQGGTAPQFNMNLNGVRVARFSGNLDVSFVPGPFRPGVFTRTTLPSASMSAGGTIYCSNPATGHPRNFTSTGTDWRDASNLLP